MTAPEDRLRTRRSSISRSVFLNQLVLTGAIVVMLVSTLILSPGRLSDPWLYAGILTFFLVTCLAATLRWDTLPHVAIAAIPILDILAIGFIRAGLPSIGAGVLLVFPVIWLASHFGRRGAITGVVFATAAVWATTPLPITADDLPRALLLPVIFSFLAVTSYTSTRRAAARSSLITQQTVLLADALAHARRQEAVLHSVLNAVDFGVISFDAAGSISFQNLAWSRRQLGLKTGTQGERILFAADGETPLNLDETPLARALRGEEYDNVVIWVHTETGDPQAVSNSARQINPDGTRGGVMVARDVTEELRAMRVRDDLVASVSHELRTPMTSVLGYLELAQDAPELSEETHMLLGVATRNAQRLLRLIGDMMAASSTASGQLSMAFAPCDFAEIVAQSAEAHLPLALARGIRLRSKCNEPVPGVGDALRLRQVFDNLISNAVKYNRDTGEIDVSIDSDDTTAWIVVRDTGIGVPDDEQSQLFERFFRAKPVRKASSGTQGLGLGLGISRDIVRAHGGDITITSVHEEGTTVLVQLPLVPPGSGQSPEPVPTDDEEGDAHV